MALVPNFTTSESLASPQNVSFVDSSTGTDGTITTRKIFCRLANGNYLTTAGESTTPAYESWSYADSTITLALLSRSTIANVTVEWYAGATLTYTKTILCGWVLYDYLFAFELLQSQTSTPSIIQNTTYYGNFLQFIVNLTNAENAVSLMDDLYSAQMALDRNYPMIQNESFYF